MQSEDKKLHELSLAECIRLVNWHCNNLAQTGLVFSILMFISGIIICFFQKIVSVFFLGFGIFFFE